MGLHLQTVSDGSYGAKNPTVTNDRILVADSADGDNMKTVLISALAGILASNVATTAITGVTGTNVQSMLQDIKGQIDGVASITGQFVGSAATFAGLPAAGNADWAILTADDGGNVRGVYISDGTNYSLVTALNDAIVAMVGATDSVDGASGLVPQPLAGEEGNFLRGDGTWATVTQGGSVGTLDEVLTEGNTTTRDLEHTTAAAGTILRAPDGTRYRVTVTNTGSLNTAAVV